ncbi:MAG TPA: rhomboid family intramembrane serine protease [Chryseolinea sp.]|nr:rhomboid family intramembrane serine protease [Chryseolinea sp.]
MASESWFSSSVVPFRIVFLMWGVFYLQYVLGWPIMGYGIVPREPYGLIGIFTAPLIHANVLHLVSNTIPMLFLGSALYFIYGKIAGQVFFRAYFWTNILVWIFARPSNHIGASGVVYAIAFFLIFFGFFRRDFLSLFISIVVVILYGGVFYGLLPNDPTISFESHLAGALVGIVSAFTFSSKKQVS